ncbi:MAG TPA: SGNH/GDSL hydrolase family protein, partial [Megamonas hypermegale]|nr:SGNH/GDSL hydrolase family protein [Megamonas hypermegale]
PVNPPKMKSVAKLDISSGWENEREKVNKWIKSQDYYVDVAEEMIDDRGFLADNLTTDGLHPDYEGKKHIGEAVGDYLRLNFEYMLY